MSIKIPSFLETHFLRCLWTRANFLEVCFEKPLYVRKHPAGALFLNNTHFWMFRDMPVFEKILCSLHVVTFFKKCSPGHCAEPHSQCVKSFHQDSFPSGQTPNIVFQPERRPEFPDDADDGGAPTIFLSGQTLSP